MDLIMLLKLQQKYTFSLSLAVKLPTTKLISKSERRERERGEAID